MADETRSAPDDDEPRSDLEQDDAEAVDGVVMPAHELRPGARRLDAVLRQSRYVSPLPPPDDLERYQQLVPDAAERMLTAGEREQTHRHQIEDRAVALDERAMPQFFRGERRAQCFALLLGLGYEGVMAFAIAEGSPVLGVLGAAAGGIAAIVWAMRARADSSNPGGRDGGGEPTQPSSNGRG